MAMPPPVYAHVTPLAWESNFFALRCARLTFAGDAPVLTPEALADYAVTQAKIPADETQTADALAAFGFRLAESEVELCLTLDGAPDDGRHDYRPALATDIPAVRDAAACAFALSRFRAPWYRPDDSGRFYGQWAENAIRGTFDDQCLLVETPRGEALGWVTLRQLDASAARIGLLAVWPGAQGQGVGGRLMRAAVAWCRQRGVRRLRVATQLGNVAALRLYQRCGARIERTAYWLYR